MRKYGDRDQESPYVFSSQRAARFTEAGIHHWFRSLKAQANKEEWNLIHDVSFHDFRHDFAHRPRSAAWTIEEVAYYLGHVTKKGTPAIQTTARYSQGSALMTFSPRRKRIPKKAKRGKSTQRQKGL